MEGLVGLPLFFENDIHLSCAMVAYHCSSYFSLTSEQQDALEKVTNLRNIHLIILFFKRCYFAGALRRLNPCQFRSTVYWHCENEMT